MNVFNTSIQLRILDINAGGHLSNDKILDYITETNSRFFMEKGYKIDNIFDSTFVVINTNIDFKKEVYYPSTLNVNIDSFEVTRLKLTFKYTFSLNDTITHSASVTGCFINKSKGITKISSEMKESLSI